MNSLHTRLITLASGAALFGGAAFAQGGDDCSIPTAIGATGSYAFDTTAATTSGFNGGGTCAAGAATINQDLFWAFTVPATGDYIFDTFGSSYDTKLSIHDGGDCNATCLDYNDDTGGLQSEVSVVGANAGDVILVQVGGFGSAFGTGTLNITQFIDPCGALVPDGFEPNDSCATAVAIGDGLYTGLNVEKTNSDFYSFTVADGATLNADMFFATATADLDFFLYDSGACLDDPNSGTTGTLAFGFSGTDDETMSWTNTTGADVDCVLRVNVWPNTGGNCNDYDLQISGAGPGGPTLFCDPANTNSAGTSVTLANSDFSGPGLVHLEAEGGPNAQFGYFLVSSTFSDPGVPVSQGVICVGAPQGRYNGVSGANSVGQFDVGGVFQNLSGTSTVGSGFDVPAALPNPPGGVIVSGDTYHFQLWYRDGVNSNFSNGLTVVFP